MRAILVFSILVSSYHAFASCAWTISDFELPKIVVAHDLDFGARTEKSFKFADGTEVEMDALGYFSVRNNTREIFNSTPSFFKIKKSTFATNTVGAPHGLVPAYAGYFLNFQEPMRIDIWQYPIVKKPKHIYVSPVLGYDTDPGRPPKRTLGVIPIDGEDSLNQPVGFTRHLRDSGYYPHDMLSMSYATNVGHVAFVATKKGSVYGMYEILRNFSGRNSWESTYDPNGAGRGMYARQFVHLVKFDLKSGTAKLIATWEGPRVPWGIEAYRESDYPARPKNFKMVLSDDETLVKVSGDSVSEPLITASVD